MDKIKRISLNILIPILFFIIGISIFCYPMLLDFQKMPGDLGDARFINYILEHGFLYLKNVEIHKEFWNMPIYYPHKNTLGYSDILLGGMLIYSPIRLIIKNPQTAFQFFYIIVCILNFITFYLFSNKIFKLKPLYSSFCAFFFAFCLIRHSQIQHIQLLLQFYMILSIFCFAKINFEQYSKLKNRLLFSGGIIFFLIQIYTTFYFGWYMLYCFPIFIISMTLTKDTRQYLKNIIKNFDKAFLFISILGFIALLPLCYHYLLVGSKFAKAEPSNILHLLFSESYLDSLFIDYSYFYTPESLLGVGLLTSILIIISIFKIKHKIPIIFFIAFLTLSFTNKHFYSFLYDNFFPMGAIRALGRYVFILIPIWAIVLGCYFKNIKKLWVSLLLMLLVAIEQIPYAPYFDWTKKQHEKRINRFISNNDCKVVYLETDKNLNYVSKDFMINNLDVMWYANNENKYCINEYSGFVFKYNTSFLDKKCFLKTK